jgi:uncharacterized protein (TIGR02118 family)
MARVIVMYKTPQDAAAFDKHFFEKHVPIAKKVPGPAKIGSQRAVTTLTGGTNYHLVAIIEFDNAAAIQNALASAEGQAGVADVQTFFHRRRRYFHVRQPASVRHSRRALSHRTLARLSAPY